MNTSHNKNRIITHGWTNVLKNLFGVSKKSIDPEDNKANNGIPQGKNQNTEPSGSTEMKEREEVSIQRNVKTNSSTINITDIEEKSEKVPNHDDKAKVSDARNILDSRIRKNNNNQNNHHCTPLHVVDLEQLGEQHSTLECFGNTKDTAEDSMKLSVKRVEFFSSIDKKTVTTANLERESELIFTFS